jgi:ACR3 family arsenite efflux pump ArsB
MMGKQGLQSAQTFSYWVILLFWFRCEKIFHGNLYLGLWMLQSLLQYMKMCAISIFLYNLWSNLYLKGFPFWGRGHISRSDFSGNIHPESLSILIKLFALSNEISKILVFAYFYQIIVCTTYLYIALYLQHYRKCKFFHEKVEVRYWYNYCRHPAPPKQFYDLFLRM